MKNNSLENILVRGEITSGRSTHADEYFFDQNFKSDKELRIMWYVLGVSYATYSQYTYKGLYYINQWQSSHKEPIEKVKSFLKSRNKISKQSYKNIREDGKSFYVYSLKIANRHLFGVLARFGLGVSKKHRKFPKHLNEIFFGDFARGILDAKGKFRSYVRPFRSEYGESTYVSHILNLFYNKDFLDHFYRYLVKYAGISNRKRIKKPPLQIFMGDAILVHDFIYRDFEFLQETGAYINVKKVSLENICHKNVYRAKGIALRIYKAKELLLKGEIGVDITKYLGYSNRSSFYRAFKNVTGQTISQFLEDNSR